MAGGTARVSLSPRVAVTGKERVHPRTAGGGYPEAGAAPGRCTPPRCQKRLGEEPPDTSVAVYWA